MINYSNLYRIYDLLGEIIFYGFHSHFSSEYIEESISSSIVFHKYLDKGSDSFINNLSYKEIFKETYNVEISEEDLHKINTISMWLGEAYLRLYFKYHKSISFIFLYFPLDKMTYMFGVYHEMDWPHLYQYFEDEIKKKSVLSILLKKRQITTYELSILTGIKYQTIINYTRSNNNIYNASFNNISKISIILNVDSNIFLEEINNYIDASYLDLQVNNTKYLTNYAFHIVSYFDKSVGENVFEYDTELELLKTDNYFFKALVTSSNTISINNIVKEYQDKCLVNCNDTFLTIFINDDIDKIDIVKNNFKKIFVITPQFLFITENSKTRKEVITRLLHESAIRLSKYSDAF